MLIPNISLVGPKMDFGAWPENTFSGQTGPKSHFWAWLARKVFFGPLNWWLARNCFLGPDNYSTWPENVFWGQLCDISGPKTHFGARPKNVFWDWHTFDNLVPGLLHLKAFYNIKMTVTKQTLLSVGLGFFIGVSITYIIHSQVIFVETYSGEVLRSTPERLDMRRGINMSK